MRAKPKFEIAPRPLNEFQTACRLNRGVEWFRQHRIELEAQGFPSKDPLLDGWDGKAIEIWMDRRSGLDSQDNNAEALALRVIRGKRAS